METYKVNLTSHLARGSNLLLGIAICIAFPYVMAHLKQESIDSFTWIAVLGLIIWGAPGLIIHVNYYMVNKRDVLTYDVQERKITLLHQEVTTTFVMEDIVRVDRFMSFNKAAGRADFAPWDGYNHSDIYLKNGQKITITSLLVPDLNLPIGGDRINVKTGIYRLASRY